MADKSSGHRLASSQSKAGRSGRASGITSGRGQWGLEHIVCKGRASHRGIGARESPESRAGSNVTVEHCQLRQLIFFPMPG